MIRKLNYLDSLLSRHPGAGRDPWRKPTMDPGLRRDDGVKMVLFLSDSNFLKADAKVAHGFFGRHGGVSTGLYGSLNCGLGTKDISENVYRNRSIVSNAIGAPAQNLMCLKQINGASCVYRSRPWSSDEITDGDAMVTDVRGVTLGILTADCGPVLFYGEKENSDPVIGAAHAGWKGAVGGILEVHC